MTYGSKSRTRCNENPGAIHRHHPKNYRSGANGGANKITGYATNLMAGLQESLKATSGIDVKELIETYAGKSNVKNSIQELTGEIKKNNE